MRCDEIFSDPTTSHHTFLLILTINQSISMNNFENRLKFGKVTAYKNGVIFGPPCTLDLRIVPLLLHFIEVKKYARCWLQHTYHALLGEICSVSYFPILWYKNRHT